MYERERRRDSEKRPMTLLEIVARALCMASHVDPDEPDPFSSAAPPPKRWEGTYSHLAIVAINAIVAGLLAPTVNSEDQSR